MNKTYICLCVMTVGFLCGFYSQPMMDKNHTNCVFPYEEYTNVLTYGDTTLYNKIVEERRIETPSHPDYFDLSIKMASKFGNTAGYYNAYLALHDLYKYNHYKMGSNVKRLMYSYLQLAMEHQDYRITKEDVKNYQTAFPNGIKTANRTTK